MLPTRRSSMARCLVSCLALQLAACASKPRHGEENAEARPDADAAIEAGSSIDRQDEEEPVETDDGASGETPREVDAEPAPTPKDERGPDAAPDSGIASDATLAAAEAGAGDASLAAADASVVDAGPAPAACQPSKVAATPVGAAKVDFVWIVDSSQSMFDDQPRLRGALETFVQRVSQSNLDVRVIMVSRTPQLQPGVPLPGLCPELPADPLAGRPFASDPRYRFVEIWVDSGAALNVAMVDYARYGAFLRSGSAVHFVVVTDDEAQYPGGAAQFLSDMNSRLGRPFHLHTFASPGPTPCTASSCEVDPNQGTVCVFLGANCKAANVGKTYYELASLTAGAATSICESDWTPGIDAILARVAQSTPSSCTYTIPPPPRGTFNPQMLNLWFDHPQGPTQETILTRVDNAGACGDLPGWMYVTASAPSEVSLCPKACAWAAAGASMTFGFGCYSLVRN